MNATRKPVRWRLVFLLGGGLGALYILVMLSLAPVEDNGPLSFSQPGSSDPPAVAPLKLSEEPVRQELTQVVASQLAAFRKNDYPAAYKFAASALQAQMPLPAFERMVRTGYAAIANSRSETFGLVLDNGREGLVNVDLVTGSGQRVHYQYLLRQERAGWRIGGVKQVVSKTTIV